MLSLSPQDFINWMHQFPADSILVVLFLFCAMAMLVMLRTFGPAGLMVYTAVGVIVGNVQVLKATQFGFFEHPVALGTVVFTSLFLCSDILTENYGKAKAQKTVWMSFSAMILMVIFMLVTLSFKPVSGGVYQRFGDAHNAMEVLFTPAPALLAASLVAYVIAQLNDIWIFAGLSKLTAGKLLWMRTLVSTLIGAFIDNLVFSTLAWMVFAPTPLEWSTTFYTFVLGTYIIRVFIAFAGIPVVYLSRLFVKK